ncbi:hypothetical protein, partial [Escherichia coli]|uniref:hypothetical protein n=1 Tax=Escherichia coli TaxID=562 RepID=UPI001BC84999
MPVLSANKAQEEQINTSYEPLTPYYPFYTPDAADAQPRLVLDASLTIKKKTYTPQHILTI